MDIKIECGCGTKYSFPVEPVQGLMPVPLRCPSCDTDGTAAANEQIQWQLEGDPMGEIAAPPTSAPTTSTALRISRSAPAATIASMPVARAQASETAWGSSQPQGLLSRSTYLVKPRVGMLQLVDTYEILDPQTGENIGIAKGEPSKWVKWSPVFRTRLPTVVNIYEKEGHPLVLSIHCGFWYFLPKVRVVAGNGQTLGYFRYEPFLKYFRGGITLEILDGMGKRVGQVGGQDKEKPEPKRKFFDLKLGPGKIHMNGRVIGYQSNSWGETGKKILTGRCSSTMTVDEQAGASPSERAMLLALGPATDMLWDRRPGSSD